MTPDHYATLGVTPTAKATAIRAAYLALMRENHPDRNPDPAATLRAQAVIAAFKVLGDFDRRNHYDWDRRREREAAAALAAKRPRKIGTGAVAAGAVGLAFIGAWVFTPPATPEPERIDQPVAKAPDVPAAKAAKARPVAKPRQVAVATPTVVMVERPAPAPPRPDPVQVAKLEPKPPKPAKAERAAVVVAVRTVAAKTPAPRVASPPATPPARQAKVAVKPVRQATRPATDLASLDQFVMNFYGQSWRYGDAPKRAALEQSRNGFVVRRGECAAEACQRAAYLKLMRDVSEIIETGQPKTR